MHNGAFDTLEQVIDFYNQGGGDDSRKDSMLRPLGLTPQEKTDLLAFLKALTGELPKVEPPELPE